MSVFSVSSFALVASCCCASRSLWCQLLHRCSGVVPLHKCLYNVIVLHWWGQLCLWHHLLWWHHLLLCCMQVFTASFALGACCTSVCLVVSLPLAVTVVSTVSTDVMMWAHFSCVCGFVCPSVPASRFCPDTIFQAAQPFATKFSNWMKYWGCHQQGQGRVFWIFREYLSNKFSYLLNLLV